MPILHNAQKALRSAERKTQMNRQVKSKLKTAMDQFQAKPSQESLAVAFSKIDKAMRRHLVHRNKAARLKSQLSKLVAA